MTRRPAMPPTRRAVAPPLGAGDWPWSAAAPPIRLLDGWAEPEAGFVWSLGGASGIELPAVAGAGEIVLLLSGTPFKHPPEFTGQRLVVEVGGQALASFWTYKYFSRVVRIPRALAGDGPIHVTLRHPDCSAPAQFGLPDDRELAIAFRRLRLLVLPPPSQEPGGLPPDEAQGAELFASALPEVLDALRHGDVGLAVARARAWCGTDRLDAEFGAMRMADVSVCTFRIEADGICRFGFDRALLDDVDSGAVNVAMVIWRWLALLPLLLAYAASHRARGFCRINLGDEPHQSGPAFCGAGADAFLLPDPYFLSSGGYAKLRRALATDTPDWSARRASALWRGSSTGYRVGDDPLTLPRLRLCLHAREPVHAPYIDAGITQFVQLRDAAEIARLQTLAADFVAPERFPEWQFHVDIDGNSNSWPGLFQKLLSGGVVLKVASESGWRQWYYDRLEPFVNYVPVAADFSDLVDKIKFLSYNAEQAEAIGRRGRALALSMTHESETAAAMTMIEDAILSETHAGMEGRRGDGSFEMFG